MKSEVLLKEDLLIALIEDLGKFEASFDLGGRFNIFEAVGMHRQEIRHSRFLGYLLDPNETHGLNDAFLRSFLLSAADRHPDFPLSKLKIVINGLSDARVFFERDHFDITIELPRLNTIVVIENKVGSGERINQLQDYRRTSLSRYPHYQFMGIFLTPDGYEGDDDRWGALSYSDVSEALRKLLDLKSAAPSVAIAIESYVQLIERHIVTSDELIQACRQIYVKHRVAIDMIKDLGGTSVFSEAYELFLREASGLQNVIDGASHAVFVDKRWVALQGFQVSDAARSKVSCPIRYLLRMRPGKLILRLEVGPVAPESRLDRGDFVRLIIDAVKGKERENSGEIITRIRTHSVTIDDDPEVEELLEKMKTLWHAIGHEETSRAVLSAAQAWIK